MEKLSYQKTMNEVNKVYLFHYPEKHFQPISEAFSLIEKLFEGRYPGYKGCNTQYHDLRHTLDALLAAARICDGYQIKNGPLREDLVQDLFMASLLHDTGYLQEIGDDIGTGAKYTLNHVQRSIEFLYKNHEQFGIAKDRTSRIAKLIQCTGLSTRFEEVPFMTAEDRIAGAFLGSADLLGQMADRQYLEKLLFLYYEFREAGIAGYETEFDIFLKTEGFYDLVKSRLTIVYLNVQEFIRIHGVMRYGIDADWYMLAIARHMSYLRKIIEDDTSNFRHKLKRGDSKKRDELSQWPVKIT
ncbi:MAG: hypothetical protein CSYNP_03603 [Syntrophus sp. SKADARSKE-3]|nr:hypothetical protein [Syntrophus sp. SKADARSKE-3]